MKFTDLNLDERILRAISELGFEECTPVQEETFALIFAGRDVEAQSQTGTGKTAAFLISGFHLLLTDEKLRGKKMLVVAPTRELADQIEKDAKVIGKYLDFSIGSFYGGVGFNLQEKLLSEGVDILIGTPGRLLDFYSSKKLDFRDVGVLVIDEADRMFDMGFLPDIRKILKGMNPPAQRRTFLFSATLNAQVGYLAWEYMTDPGEIVVEPDHVSVQAITQELYHVSHEEKMPLLLGLLKKYDPKCAVFFVNTKHTAVKIAKRLSINGYATEYLIGDLPQAKRLQIIQNLKEKKINWLVATDVAARGLHVDDLDLVVNYDLPLEAETYVHRIGRTARAGKSGRAISLACEKYVYGLKAIEEFVGLKIPVQWAEEKDITTDKSAGMHISGDFESASQRRPRENERERPGQRPGQRPARHERSAEQRGFHSARNLVAEAASGRPGTGRQSKPERTERPPRAKSSSPRSNAIPAPTASLEDRLAFYKKKYGAEFDKGEQGKPVVPPPKNKPNPGKPVPPRTPQVPSDSEKPSLSGEKRRRRRRPRKDHPQVPAAVVAQPVATQKKENIFQKILGFFSGKKKDKVE